MTATNASLNYTAKSTLHLCYFKWFDQSGRLCVTILQRVGSELLKVRKRMNARTATH